MKQIIPVIFGFLLFAGLTRPVRAESSIAIPSAQTVQSTASAHIDDRATLLGAYLAFHNSPMEQDADHFVREADRLGLDWKLVAAIAGVESTFGKHVPMDSYNGWGWGIFTGQSDGIHFASWKAGITEVSEGLKYNYIDRGATSIEQIGRIYAASPTWSEKVSYFMKKIDEFEPSGVDHLAVTI